jgi:hypothetical protein
MNNCVLPLQESSFHQNIDSAFLVKDTFHSRSFHWSHHDEVERLKHRQGPDRRSTRLCRQRRRRRWTTPSHGPWWCKSLGRELVLFANLQVWLVCRSVINNYRVSFFKAYTNFWMKGKNRENGTFQNPI